MSSTSRRMPSRAAARAALLAAAAFAAPALAQSPSSAPLNIPGAASAPPPVVQHVAPPPSVPERPQIIPPGPAPVVPPPGGQQAQSQPQNQIAVPGGGDLRRPGNGQVPLPPVGVQKDVDGSLDRQRDLAVRRLQQTAPETLPAAEVGASGNELDFMASRQRRVRELKVLNQEADETKKLYQTMKEIGDLGGAAQSQAQQGRSAQPQISELEVQRRVEEATKRAAEEERARRQRERNSAIRPVVASISGAAGVRSAIVLVPYVGEMTVQVGSTMPEGMRVTAINEKGVEVVQRGRRFNLGFGDTVPRYPQQTVGAQSGAPVGNSAPIMNQPLPIGGGLSGASPGSNPRLPPVAVPSPGVQSPATFVR